MSGRKKKQPEEISVAEATKTLGAKDLAAMTLASVRMAMRRARAGEAQARYELACAQMELQRIATEASAARAVALQKAALERCQQELDNEQKTATLVASEVGQRYAIDWKKAAFHPDTGVLTQLPQEATNDHPQAASL